MIKVIDNDIAVKVIKQVRDKIEKAKTIKCTCSGFMLQYNQGCFCKRGKTIRYLEKRLNRLIGFLQ